METSKKIFISQPMSDKTNEEILSERASAVETLNKQFNDIEVLIASSRMSHMKLNLYGS